MNADEAREVAEALRHLDPLARELHGKSIMDCTWDEIREMGRWIDSQYAQAVHTADQAKAELRERARCGETS